MSTIKTQGKAMYKRETSKERKLREAMDPKCLVGFGKYDIADVLDMIGDPEWEFKALFGPQLLGPPRWRAVRSCDDQELKDASIYVEWADELLTQKDEEDEKAEKVIKDIMR